MKVGDLVKYHNLDWIGVIIREIAGHKVVMWNTHTGQCLQDVEGRYLKVVHSGD